jgi:tetratricopeptide (TPR) repeat protein
VSADPTPAVFLSYASQDAEAAKRICEALRGAGVEVWFDQSELRGGDAWDQKIRRQIKDCALFVPIISANTQSRPEGYFRLEWKLAVDRSHLLADDHPFLFPVVIDDTPDATARVPERFREVQWTRLNVKDTPETLAARVAKLLGHGFEADAGDRGRADRRRGPERKPTDKWIARVAVIFGLLISAFYATRPFWPSRSRETPPGANRTAPPARPPSEAARLVTQARALYEPWDFASADDLKLAERLLKEASDREPANADAYAGLAIVCFANYIFGFDRSDARDALLRNSADRAMKLAPNSDNSRLAMAARCRRGPGMNDEALRLLLDLETRHRDDKFILRQIAGVFVAKNQTDDALKFYRHAAELPGGDAIALVAEARILQSMGRLDEADLALDRAIALRPDYGFARVIKLVLAFYERGDVEQTKAVLQQIPAGLMNDDRVAAIAAFMWYFLRDADRAGEALRFVPRDYVESNVVTMPKGLLAGWIHQLAGRREAAVAEWRVALRLLEQRLAANPTSVGDVGDKAGVLALLGERAAAEEALRVYEQLQRMPVGRVSGSSWVIYAALGRADEVADFFSERLKRDGPDGAKYAAFFRCHPVLDPFRQQPRFQALAAEAEKVFAKPGKAAQPGGVAKPAP